MSVLVQIERTNPAVGRTARYLPTLLVGCAGAAIAAVAGALFSQPGYMDAYYYYHVAANIADGRGLAEAFIWNYLPPPAAVVHPSNLYWMPLTSFAMAPFLALFGVSYHAAQVPFVLATGLLAAVSFWLALRLLGSPWRALAAATLTVFSGYYFVYWSALDSFALFAVFVTLGLVWSTPPEPDATAAGSSRWLRALGAGLMAGLAHLARADGLLLLAIVLARGERGESEGKGERGKGNVPPLSPFPFPLSPRFPLILAGYLIVMGPWFVRNLVVVGAPLQAGGLRTLFLTEYNDLFSYARDLSPASYLAWGIDNVLRSKAEALGRNLLVLFGMEYHLLPFAAIGLWSWRRRLDVQRFLLYALGLYLAMSLVFTFPSGRGSMLHSSAALLPWLAAAAVAGIDRTVLWLAARRAHWNPPIARRNFLIIFVLFAVGVSSYLIAKSAATWDDRKQQYDALASWLAAHAGANDLVMLVDPPGYFYSSGRSSVVTPSDGVEAAGAVARRYGVRYLALEAVHARPFRPLYRGEQTDQSLERVGEVGDIQIYRFRDVP